MLDLGKDIEIAIGIGTNRLGEETLRPSVDVRGLRLVWFREFFSLDELDSLIAALVEAGHPDTEKVKEERKEFARLLAASPTQS
jgi:hypothetical protein